MTATDWETIIHGAIDRWEAYKIHEAVVGCLGMFGILAGIILLVAGLLYLAERKSK